MAGPSYLSALAAALTLFCGVSKGLPQTTTDIKPTAKANSAPPIARVEPGPTELRSLTNALSGKWALSVKFMPMDGIPNGLAGRGEELWRQGPGNYTLVEEENIPTPGGRGYLLGIFWWDSKSESLRGMECNNQAPSTCDLKGALADITVTWDGKKLVIDEVETHDGKKTVWHEAWSDITPTSFIQTGDVTQPDGSTARFMTIQATKAKD
jgi:hypothetical protein